MMRFVVSILNKRHCSLDDGLVDSAAGITERKARIVFGPGHFSVDVVKTTRSVIGC